VDTACAAGLGLRGHELHFVFDCDPELRLTLSWPEEGKHAQPQVAGELASAAEVAVGRTIEAGISLEALGVQPGCVGRASSPTALGLAIQLLHEGRSIERWPETGFLKIEYRGQEAASDTWFV